MKPILPNKQDITDAEMAMRSFDSATGTVDILGEYNPGRDPRIMYLLVMMTIDEMSLLWKFSGINTDETSSYKDMLDTKQPMLDIRFFKVKKGLFKNVWVGNVSFFIDGGAVGVGSIAGKAQAEMWIQLKKFIGLEHQLHDSTLGAYESV